MKKHIIPLLAGIIVSYCFASMVLNQRIVNPVTAFGNKALVVGWDELLAGSKDIEAVSENRLRSTSTAPWIEIKNIRERVGKLRSVTYKIKPVDEMDGIKTRLCYADAEEVYNDYRSLTAMLTGGAVIFEIPDYAGPIDKLRLDLTSLNDVTFEIEEISLNMNKRFSAPLMAFIYVLWCLVIYLGGNSVSSDVKPESRVEKKTVKLS